MQKIGSEIEVSVEANIVLDYFPCLDKTHLAISDISKNHTRRPSGQEEMYWVIMGINEFGCTKLESMGEFKSRDEKCILMPGQYFQINNSTYHSEYNHGDTPINIYLAHKGTSDYILFAADLVNKSDLQKIITTVIEFNNIKV